jgi:hypothetical protein
LVMAPAFRFSLNVLIFCTSVMLVFSKNWCSMAFMKSCGLWFLCSLSPQNRRAS